MPKKIASVKKRDGRIVPFDPDKIKTAVHKAVVAVLGRDKSVSKKIAVKAVSLLEKRLIRKIPTVEQIQDIAQEVLIDSGYPRVAKTYAVYRKRRTEVRKTKKIVGVKDELKLSVNALTVLKKRYLLKDEKGNVTETPAALFRRVSRAVARSDRLYNKKANLKRIEEDFYRIMSNLEFLPNSPTLMNAGTAIGQLSACFVIPVGDSLAEIFESVKDMAIIQQSGGGTGFSFSRLRPKGDIVKSTHGVASGPVSFMRIFNETTEVIKQGGRRRGANMGILQVDHPDILEFITSKMREGVLVNFNISVGATNKFMRAAKAGKKYDLINPRTGKTVNRLDAKKLFYLITSSAWKSGDPGMIFIDEINKHNPTPRVGRIESTNPCGEQPLLPYESCNLGSINLVRMLNNKKLDWDKLRKTVRLAVHFLDNVIDINKYPIARIKAITLANRKIGLGVMGFAEMLIRIGIPYDSYQAVNLGKKIMRFIKEAAYKKSSELAKERGSFPNFKGSIWQKRGFKKFRNATVTTIAPTGTISIIADCTSGIEPLFAVSFTREVMEGTRLLEVNPIFERIAMEKGFYNKELMEKIALVGTVRGISEVPSDVRNIFKTALDIEPVWHVKMQAAFQKHTDNAVSKTVNLPESATEEDVREIFNLAYKLKCKGITVFRYGSKKGQVLYRGTSETKGVTAESEFSGGCPTIYCPY